MLQKGFRYTRESYVGGRHMKLYAGQTTVFDMQFNNVSYTWNQITVPMGGIETIIFTHRVNGLSDPAIADLRDILTSIYGYPDCNGATLTCKWKLNGKVAAMLHITHNNMNLFLINPHALNVE